MANDFNHVLLYVLNCKTNELDKQADKISQLKQEINALKRKISVEFLIMLVFTSISFLIFIKNIENVEDVFIRNYIKPVIIVFVVTILICLYLYMSNKKDIVKQKQLNNELKEKEEEYKKSLLRFFNYLESEFCLRELPYEVIEKYYKLYRT